MPRSRPLPFRVNETWKYALLGGLASIPLTVGLYWLSGTGNELSLNMVFFGGLLAGYLAGGASTEVDSAGVGVRAGVVGGLPGLWLLSDVLGAVAGVAGPVAFRVAAVVMAVMAVVSVAAVVLGVSGVVGLLGAKVGAWLAEKTGRKRIPVVG